MHEIPNEELRPEHLPEPDAPWPAIAEFAVTCDGYEPMGDDLLPIHAMQACEKWRKEGSLPSGLLDLRSCLLMEQRAVRWAENNPYSNEPTRERLACVRALLEAIRLAVTRASSLDGNAPGLDRLERDDVFAPGELEVGALTSAEREQIMLA